MSPPPANSNTHTHTHSLSLSLVHSPSLPLSTRSTQHQPQPAQPHLLLRLHLLIADPARVRAFVDLLTLVLASDIDQTLANCSLAPSPSDVDSVLPHLPTPSAANSHHLSPYAPSFPLRPATNADRQHPSIRPPRPSHQQPRNHPLFLPADPPNTQHRSTSPPHPQTAPPHPQHPTHCRHTSSSPPSLRRSSAGCDRNAATPPPFHRSLRSPPT